MSRQSNRRSNGPELPPPVEMMHGGVHVLQCRAKLRVFPPRGIAVKPQRKIGVGALDFLGHLPAVHREHGRVARVARLAPEMHANRIENQFASLAPGDGTAAAKPVIHGHERDAMLRPRAAICSACYR